MENDFSIVKNIVSENIKILRRRNNWSQEDLADICGLHRTYIGSVERGEKNVTIKTLIKISNAFNLPISLLFKKIER